MSLFDRRTPGAPASAPVQDEVITLTDLASLMAECTSADTYDEVVDRVLHAVIVATGWQFALVRHVSADGRTLRWYRSVGEVPTVYQGRGGEYGWSRGEGAAGAAWERKDVVYIPDIANDPHPYAVEAGRIGLVSTVAMPLIEDGTVVGVVEFHGTRAQPASIVPIMQIIGTTLGQVLYRLRAVQRIESSRIELEATSAVLHNVNAAAGEHAAARAALDTIRTEFGWAYGSVWRVNEDGVLAFDVESGDAGSEFREVTRAATFARGVGLAGRTWSTGDLVFEPDMSQVTDCVRAPAAGRAGVKSGVCLPLTIDGEIVGTMDFFSTTIMELTADREEALRNTAYLVSDSLARQRSAARIHGAGQELLSSITRVEANVEEAAGIAAEASATTRGAAEIVERLSASSAEIGNVVKVITKIAEQTNLLALNATIEAARAGEAGKGFAVVAGEVKELARDTAQATDEVESKVAAIQVDARNIVEALQHVIESVSRIDDAQNVISGVLSEQNEVTRSVLQS